MITEKQEPILSQRMNYFRGPRKERRHPPFRDVLAGDEYSCLIPIALLYELPEGFNATFNHQGGNIPGCQAFQKVCNHLAVKGEVMILNVPGFRLMWRFSINMSGFRRVEDRQGFRKFPVSAEHNPKGRPPEVKPVGKPWVISENGSGPNQNGVGLASPLMG